MSEGVYEELAMHLDKAVAGAPMSPALMGILKILYPGEEAEVALRLAIYENRTLADVEAAIPEKAGRRPLAASWGAEVLFSSLGSRSNRSGSRARTLKLMNSTGVS